MKVDRCIKIVLKFNQRPHFCVLSYVRIWRIWLKTREKAISRSLTPKNIIYQLELSPRWVDYYFYHPFYQYRKQSTQCCLVGVFFTFFPIIKKRLFHFRASKQSIPAKVETKSWRILQKLFLFFCIRHYAKFGVYTNGNFRS